jgi:cytochrome b6-f complex iron-sulfur subunit
VLRWLVRAFLSLWGLGAAALGISFLKAPESGGRVSESAVKCGSFSSLPVGSARFIRHGTDPLFVVRASETEVVALSAICTHLRCVLHWDDETKMIRCPCHAGSFDRSGNVLSGLPPRSLRTHPAEVRADEIVVRVS